MRTTPLVALTAAVSAAVAAPVAIAAHEGSGTSLSLGSIVQQFQGRTDSNSTTNRSRDGSSNTASPDGTNAQDPSTTQPQSGNSSGGDSSDSPTTTASDTTTTASAAQSKGVVMVDVALPNGQAAGSGMVLTADGTVLTNYHVVSGSTQIRVTVPGGQAYTASVVGHDKSHDVAVLKLQGAKNLATVKLDTDGVKLSEKVLAVGQGKGEGVLYAATGIVTATGRSITASEQGSLSSGENLTNLVQTNAPIVAGYSGGPLFDADGEVIGIDTAASATNSLTGYSSRGAEGYAIPIAQAKSIADDILRGTKTATNHIGARGALGIAVMPSGSTDRSQTTASGVTVQQLLSGSAMSRTGVAAGDTITALDGRSITSTDDLSDVMDTRSPGASMKVAWVDATGASHTSTVTLGKATTN